MSALDAIISTREAALLCDVTPRRLQQLESEGRMSKTARGQHVVREVVHGYVAVLRDDIRRAGRSDAANKVAEARAREIELRIAREDGRLISLDEHNEIFDEVVATVRLGFDALPIRVTNDLAMRDAIEGEIRTILAGVADKFEARAAELGEAPTAKGGKRK